MSNTMRTLAMLTFLAPAVTRAGEFFPIRPGNVWTYRADRGEQTLTIRVADTGLFLGGRTYYRLFGYVAEPVWVRNDERDGSLFYLDDQDQDALLTSFEPGEGFWANAPKRQCDQMSQVATRRGKYSGSAGEFNSVLDLRYRSFPGCADAGFESEQYAENIGLLRRTVTTFAGPVTFDLVHAVTGSIVIAERPRTSFSISLRLDRETQQASLRLNNIGGNPFTLRFPSSQEFDIVVKNAAGDPVWRWSDGRFFLPAAKEKQAGHLAWEAEIPVSPNGFPLPPGEYIAEAWLTTAGDRQFAAATSFFIPEVTPSSNR